MSAIPLQLCVLVQCGPLPDFVLKDEMCHKLHTVSFIYNRHKRKIEIFVSLPPFLSEFVHTVLPFTPTSDEFDSSTPSARSSELCSEAISI